MPDFGYSDPEDLYTPYSPEDIEMLRATRPGASGEALAPREDALTHLGRALGPIADVITTPGRVIGDALAAPSFRDTQAALDRGDAVIGVSSPKSAPDFAGQDTTTTPGAQPQGPTANIPQNPPVPQPEASPITPPSVPSTVSGPSQASPKIGTSKLDAANKRRDEAEARSIKTSEDESAKVASDADASAAYINGEIEANQQNKVNAHNEELRNLELRKANHAEQAEENRVRQEARQRVAKQIELLTTRAAEAGLDVENAFNKDDTALKIFSILGSVGVRGISPMFGQLSNIIQNDLNNGKNKALAHSRTAAGALDAAVSGNEAMERNHAGRTGDLVHEDGNIALETTTAWNVFANEADALAKTTPQLQAKNNFLQAAQVAREHSAAVGKQHANAVAERELTLHRAQVAATKTAADRVSVVVGKDAQGRDIIGHDSADRLARQSTDRRNKFAEYRAEVMTAALYPKATEGDKKVVEAKKTLAGLFEEQERLTTERQHLNMVKDYVRVGQIEDELKKNAEQLENVTSQATGGGTPREQTVKNAVDAAVPGILQRNFGDPVGATRSRAQAARRTIGKE